MAVGNTTAILISLKEVVCIIGGIVVVTYVVVASVFSIIAFRTYFNTSSIDTNIDTYTHISDTLLRLIDFCKENSLEVEELYYLYNQLDKHIQYFNFLELHSILVYYREEVELIDIIDSAKEDPYMLEAVLIGVERLIKQLSIKRSDPHSMQDSSIKMQLDLFGRILR